MSFIIVHRSDFKYLLPCRKTTFSDFCYNLHLLGRLRFCTGVPAAGKPIRMRGRRLRRQRFPPLPLHWPYATKGVIDILHIFVSRFWAPCFQIPSQRLILPLFLSGHFSVFVLFCCHDFFFIPCGAPTA